MPQEAEKRVAEQRDISQAGRKWCRPRARANQQVEAAWGNVEAQYQRRFDFIPNLTEATKGFLQQERTVFEAIAEARTRYAGAPAGSPQRVAAANQLETALARLLVIVEN